MVPPHCSVVQAVVVSWQPHCPSTPPPPQVSPVPVQGVQAPPPVPQAASLSIWHCPAASQQPPEQLVAVQAQAPFRHSWFAGQASPQAPQSVSVPSGVQAPPQQTDPVAHPPAWSSPTGVWTQPVAGSQPSTTQASPLSQAIGS